MKTVKINATDKILGRLATKVANILRGKNKTEFAYNKIVGDKVIIYNAEKIKVTGNKFEDKMYYKHSGYIGNLKQASFRELFEKNPAIPIRLAIKNMLPKNRLQPLFMKNLTIKTGDLDVNK